MKDKFLQITIVLLLSHERFVDSYKVSLIKTAQEFQKSLNEANPGDKIYLQGALLKGQFVASKSGTNDSRITVIAAQGLPEPVKVVGEGTNKAALNITGNYWIFSNFSISNRHALGLLVGGNNNIIQGVEIKGVAKAVRIKGDRNFLQDCIINEAKMGIYLEGDLNVIANNFIYGADPAVFGRKRTCCGDIRGNRYNGKLIVDGFNYTFA